MDLVTVQEQYRISMYFDLFNIDKLPEKIVCYLICKKQVWVSREGYEYYVLYNYESIVAKN